ncbi:MAG: hypothetical protein WAM39_00940 [Bryobacteraceae bacterium]
MTELTSVKPQELDRDLSIYVDVLTAVGYDNPQRWVTGIAVRGRFANRI